MSSGNSNLSEHWSRQKAVYQIYPLSFKDTNGDGWGDLRGIIEKLDYIKELGVGAVWLCPFYRSPMADFGYDISDYKAIDPKLGTMKDFEDLVEGLHNRDIKVMVDFVGNHTSVEHEWFKESRSSRENSKRDWYIWRDPREDGGPPNNWISVFGGSAWEFDRETGQYYLHSFLKEQADLNWRHPGVVAMMNEIVDFWVSKGVDGFRVDALEHFIEDEKMENDPANPLYREGVDESYKSLVHRFSVGDIKQMKIIGDFFNKVLERHKDLFIIGEIYTSPSELVKLYELCPGGRFAPFNFNLIGLPWDAVKWKKSIDEYQSLLAPSYLANYTLGNHDVSRVGTRLGEVQANLAAFLQFTLPGMPFVYYGDELGMLNGVVETSAIRDVLAKIFRGLHPGRDLERTPMQWDDSPHAGFTSGRPWLPVSSNYKTLNVAHQSKDKQSTLELFKSLFALRNASANLRIGEYVPRDSASPSIFSFRRKFGDETLLVIANFGDSVSHEHIMAGERPLGREPKVLFTTSAHRHVHISNDSIELLPYEGYVVRL